MNSESSDPAPSAAAEPGAAPPQEQPAPGGGRRVRLIAIGALAALAAGGYLYFQLQRMAAPPPVEPAAQQAAREAPATSAPPAVEASTTTAADSVARELPSPRLAPASAAVATDELERRLAALEDRVATLESPPETGALALAAAAEFVTLAEQRLRLARDVDGARTALELAAARLTGGDFSAQRRALRADLAALEGFHDLDVAALSAELAEFARTARELPLLGPPPSSPAIDTTKGDGWRGLAGAIWDALRGLVEVHDADAARDPLLNPAYEILVRQQLALDLDVARSAASRRDTAAFRAALQPAIDGLAERFETQDAAVARVLARLRAMQEIDLAPALPPLADSAALLGAPGPNATLRPDARADVPSAPTGESAF